MYHKQLCYVSYSTIPTITVPWTRSVGATWMDDLIKHSLAEEKKFFVSYRCVNLSFFVTYIYYHYMVLLEKYKIGMLIS